LMPRRLVNMNRDDRPESCRESQSSIGALEK
jgi:hypothetical protein